MAPESFELPEGTHIHPVDLSKFRLTMTTMPGVSLSLVAIICMECYETPNSSPALNFSLQDGSSVHDLLHAVMHHHEEIHHG